jgi:heterogeneous nuclear rnp K-like protein 2
LENPISSTTNNTSTTATTTTTNTTTTTTNTINPVVTLRLLISHNLMGTVIGRQGAKIKHIQDNAGVKMTASKALLPQSTERVVEVRGTVSAIQQAVAEIGTCLLEDKDRAYGTILYNPSKISAGSVTIAPNNTTPEYNNSNNNRRSTSSYNSTNINNNNDPNTRVQHISIPSDMVGCIIGKGGSKISEIRQLSGSYISIAKVPHDESGERMFTIQGTADSNERALYLLYGQLEAEKERRLRGVMQQQQDNVVLLDIDEEEEEE